MTATAPVREWPRRAASRARTRAALLEAAVACGVHSGYRRTTLEEIAAAAGVTTGSVYSIFGDKRSLFLEAFAPAAAMPELQSLAPLGSPMADVMAAIAEWCSRVLADPLTRGAWLVSLELAGEYHDDAAFMASVHDRQRRQLEALTADFSVFLAAEHSSASAADLAAGLVMTVNGLLTGRMVSPFVTDDLVRWLIGQLWK